MGKRKRECVKKGKEKKKENEIKIKKKKKTKTKIKIKNKKLLFSDDTKLHSPFWLKWINRDKHISIYKYKNTLFCKYDCEREEI